MNAEKINKVQAEVARLQSAINALNDEPQRFFEYKGDKIPHRKSPRLTGAVRRASMDLTRALAELRKPS